MIYSYLYLFQKAFVSHQKIDDQIESKWVTTLKQIDTAFSANIGKLVTGQQGFQKTFVSIADSLVNDTAQMLTKEAVQWAEHWAALHILHLAAKQVQVATETAGDAEKHAVVAASNIAEITSDAGLAGAAAFASVMEALPFPANIAAAPGVAAGASAATEAFAVEAAFGGGGVADHDMIAGLHANEMVLAPSLSAGIQNMVRNANSGSGGTRVHYAPNVYGSGTHEFKKILRAHSDEIVQIVRREYRRGNLKVG